jgi:hypothetical protein
MWAKLRQHQHQHINNAGGVEITKDVKSLKEVRPPGTGVPVPGACEGSKQSISKVR